MTRELRAFYATRKDTPAHIVSEHLLALSEAFRKALGGAVGAVLTSAEDDYNANFGRLGGWEPWQRDVATGIRFSDREPRYHIYVVTEMDVGRATAEILKQALRAAKVVMYFDLERNALERVVGVVDVNADDWKYGWSIRLASDEST
jgi:hypothetical protein